MERITGDGIGEVVRELVFEPLGMTSSTLVWNPDTLSRTASPHNSRGEVRTNWEKSFRAIHAYAEKAGKPINTLRYDDYAAFATESGGPVLPNGMRPNAAASLVTSAEDYARFLATAIRNPELGQQQVVINEFLGWGLGWAIERAEGHTLSVAVGRQSGIQELRPCGTLDGRRHFCLYEW